MSRREGDGNRAARDQMLERPLPHSADAERAILGSIILDNTLIDEAFIELDAEDFYVRAHYHVWRAMVALARVGSPIDPLLVAEQLRREGALEQVGGVSFVSELSGGLPRFRNLTSYTKVVRDFALARRLYKVATRIASDSLENEHDAAAQLATAEQMIFELGAATRGDLVRRFDQIGRAVRDEFALWQEGRTNAVPTGIPELDQKLKLGGLAKKDLIYVAARSSRGKTALALQFATQAACLGVPVLIFALEMGGESLYLRAHAGVADVEHWKLRPDNIRDDASFREHVLSRMPHTDRLEIYVDEHSRTLAKIESVVRHYVRRYKVGLVIGDYIQLVDSELRGGNREQEVGKVSRGFKGIAKACDLPLVATSQLNRKGGDTERPELENLRESGQQEQDADVVMMPYNVNKNDIEQPVRSMKLYVPKQRNGRAGFEIEIDFDADRQRFKTEQMYADEEIEAIRREPVEPVYDEPAPPDERPARRRELRLPTGFAVSDFTADELREYEVEVDD